MGEFAPPTTVDTSTPGSSARSFAVAFGFILVVGGGLVFGGLAWAAPAAVQGIDGAIVGVGCAGLSALLARMASFQVATSVATDAEGIRISWRGPFGGHQEQRIPWKELREVTDVRLDGTCWLMTGAPIDSALVTLAQARAVLHDPRCPIRDLPRRIAARMGSGRL